MWPKCSRDTAVVAQVSDFECKFEKIKKWDLIHKDGSSFFSSDSKLA